MDGLTLLNEARSAGLSVQVKGARLIIRGPRRAEPIARRLMEHKPAVLMALNPDYLPADWHFLWDERAAIMEYDGGLPRERAEAAALKEVLERMEREGIHPKNILDNSASSEL